MENINDKKFEGVKAEKIDGHISIKADKPTYREVKDAAGNICDYQDVKIEGYANTFTLDRGGEQVIPGAFAEHLEEFLENPVLLCDHDRDTKSACGSVRSAYEDATGLKISAMISNSPDPKMVDLRFKLVEGILCTLSIGGMFHAKMLGEIIILYKVELREISIVTVPMNKKSLFEVKADAVTRASVAPGLENIASVKSTTDTEQTLCIDGKKITKESIKIWA